MSIEYKGETTDWVKKGIQLDLLVNGKEVDIRLEIYTSDYDMGGDVSYEITNIEKEGDNVELTDEELDEVDNFINNNY